jgi:hypothetical protein
VSRIKPNIPKGEPVIDTVRLDTDDIGHASIPTDDWSHSPPAVDQDANTRDAGAARALPSGIVRPPSHQASARAPPSATHADHMSAIIEDDPDVSVFEIQPKAAQREKPKAGTKRARAASSGSEEFDKVAPYEPLQEIPYSINILKHVRGRM